MEEKLKELRKQKKVSQSYLAEIMGIGRSAFSKKENGDSRFTVTELETYAKAMGVELALICRL
jgi:transcriptional regulator with XRE-family HTH domain